MQVQLNDLYEKYNVSHTLRNELNKLFAIHGIDKFNKGLKQGQNDLKTVEKWSNRN